MIGRGGELGKMILENFKEEMQIFWEEVNDIGEGKCKLIKEGSGELE